ncbi:25872_t:CDS:2, partial [Gigaspora rosea]
GDVRQPEQEIKEHKCLIMKPSQHTRLYLKGRPDAGIFTPSTLPGGIDRNGCQNRVRVPYGKQRGIQFSNLCAPLGGDVQQPERELREHKSPESIKA